MNLSKNNLKNLDHHLDFAMLTDELGEVEMLTDLIRMRLLLTQMQQKANEWVLNNPLL